MTELDDRIRIAMAAVAASAPGPPPLPGGVRTELRPSGGLHRGWIAGIGVVVATVAGLAVFVARSGTAPSRVITHPGPSSSARPEPSPSTTISCAADCSPATAPARLTPGQVAGALRAVTGVNPVLLPSAIPASWTAEVRAIADYFDVVYAGPQHQHVELSVSIPNPPPPSSATTQRTMVFRGDRSAFYQAQVQVDPNSDRYLLWNEPGQWAGDPQIANSARAQSAPYYLTSTGVSDGDFWAIANSLQPISTNDGTITPNDPAVAFRQLAAGLPLEHANTGVIGTPNGDIAAVSFNVRPSAGGTQPVVQILAFQGGGWTKVATVTLDVGGVVQSPVTNTTPISATHLTGSATPDFAVIVSYNDGPAGAIVSDVGGTWHALAFTGGPHSGGNDEITDPTFTSTGVTERFNTCTPDCAAGSYSTVTYRYAPQTGKMTAV